MWCQLVAVLCVVWCASGLWGCARREVGIAVRCACFTLSILLFPWKSGWHAYAGVVVVTFWSCNVVVRLLTLLAIGFDLVDASRHGLW